MANEETIKRREYRRQYHIENRDRINERSRQWYYQNRDKVNSKHKERMQFDPEYRERKRQIQKKADAKHYAKLKASKPPVNVDNASREIDGKTVQTFTLSEAAKLLGIGNSTLGHWLLNGSIPPPLFEKPILFTRTQVYLMRELKAAGRKRNEREIAKRHICKDWKWH